LNVFLSKMHFKFNKWGDLMLDLIPTGHEKAISRSALVQATGKTDRMVREQIENLRKEGIPICSTSHSKGYFLPQTEEEFKRFIREYKSHSLTMIKTADTMERAYALKNQISIQEAQ
jgi:biotin operon repressor